MSSPAKRELGIDTGSVTCMSIAQVHIKPGTTLCVSLWRKLGPRLLSTSVERAVRICTFHNELGS